MVANCHNSSAAFSILQLVREEDSSRAHAHGSLASSPTKLSHRYKALGLTCSFLAYAANNDSRSQSALRQGPGRSRWGRAAAVREICSAGRLATKLSLEGGRGGEPAGACKNESLASGSHVRPNNQG